MLLSTLVISFCILIDIGNFYPFLKILGLVIKRERVTGVRENRETPDVSCYIQFDTVYHYMPYVERRG